MWILLIGAGLWFSLGSGLWQGRRLLTIFRETFGRLGDKRPTESGITPFQAMSTALASTVGTGNIAGVATAIVAGGPGAIFWMWVSAFLGMMTKYAEVFLAVKYRRKNREGKWYGGPMLYMEALGWTVPALIFAAFGLFAALGVGNLTQVNTVAEAALTVFGVPKGVTGLVVMGLAAVVMLGGIGSIAKVTEKLVPLMAGLYIALAAAVLAVCHSEILPAFRMIVVEAFHPGAALGGAAGYGMSLAMRYGISRGVFTHEAGLGSAPLAHACADTDSPVRQGMWGAMEVFIDTLVICTLTALVILCTGVWVPHNGAQDGAALTVAGFARVLGSHGAAAVAVCTALFAFATILGWSFYGEQCCKYLFSNRWTVKAYRIAYIALLLPGAMMQVDFVWRLADWFNGCMALPNICAILALSGEVFTSLRRKPQLRTEIR